VTDGRQRGTARNPLTGAAGEYYVAAELCRRRWAASITPRNTQRTDIIAQHLEQRITVAVQVKTMAIGSNFTLTIRDEATSAAQNEWYILVDLRDQRPVYYVMPRNLVSAYLHLSHRLWLATPGRGGRRRGENTRRAIQPDEVQSYRDRWDALLKPTERCRTSFRLASSSTSDPRRSACHELIQLAPWLHRKRHDPAVARVHPRRQLIEERAALSSRA
jgi:hypothetical protein